MTELPTESTEGLWEQECYLDGDFVGLQISNLISVKMFYPGDA